MDPALKKTVKNLLYLVLGMFCFTFALIPFYNVFCKVTGINGKVDITKGSQSRYKIEPTHISNRFITIELDVNRNQQLPCAFSADQLALQVKPGELNLATYTVKNLSNKRLVIQAIPSISPGTSAKYLKKLECFCFERQVLHPFETINLSLRFWLEPEIPDSIHRLTLSYTLFDVTAL